MKLSVLAIDQGTTSTKVLVLDRCARVVGSSASGKGIESEHPRAGWVQFDPEQLLLGVINSANDAVQSAGASFEDIGGIGLANQGETVIAFDAADGRALAPAISWQDRRSEELIERWRSDGLGPEVIERTGLVLDPYFSAGKLRWILDSHPDLTQRIAAGTKMDDETQEALTQAIQDFKATVAY